jgi:hypothetical protein
MMAEGLGRSPKEDINSRNLQGLNLHNSYLPISHSQFVDDTMLMGIPIAREARTIKKVLEDFMDASEMAINHLMSQILFINTLWQSSSMSSTFWDFHEAPFHPNI